MVKLLPIVCVCVCGGQAVAIEHTGTIKEEEYQRLQLVLKQNKTKKICSRDQFVERFSTE